MAKKTTETPNSKEDGEAQDECACGGTCADCVSKKVIEDGKNEYPDDLMEEVPRTHGAAFVLLTPDEGGGEYDPQDGHVDSFSFARKAIAKEDESLPDVEETAAVGDQEEEEAEGGELVALDSWVDPIGPSFTASFGILDEKEKIEEIHPPLACRSEFVDPALMQVYPYLIHRHNANPETGISQTIDIVETYDWSKAGPILLWEKGGGAGVDVPGGGFYIIDGHHRAMAAKNARHIGVTGILEGQFNETSRRIPAIIFSESDGWTIMLARKLGEAANLGGGLKIKFEEDLVDAGASRILTPTEAEKLGKKDSVEALQALADSEDSIGLFDEFEAEYEVITDSARPGVLGTLRQIITRANFKTLSGVTYEYPGALGPAIERANSRYKTRHIHSEMNHPALVAGNGGCDKNGCGLKFVNNFDHVTGTPIRVELPDKAGSVWGVREILDTDDGRKVWAAAQRKDPIPVSVRWFCDQEAARSGKPKWLDLVTWDDVEYPNMPGAGSLTALTDSTDQPGIGTGETMTDPSPEEAWGLGEPFNGVNRNMVNPFDWPDSPSFEALANADSSASTAAPSRTANLPKSALRANGKAMNHTDLMKPVRAFAVEMRKGANKTTKQNLALLDAQATTAIREAFTDGLDVRMAVRAYQTAFLDGSQEAGYHPESSGPYIELGNELGSDPLGGWAKDLRDIPENNVPNEDRGVQQRTKMKVVPMSKSGIRDGEETEEEKKDREEKAEMKEKEKDRKEKVESKMDALIFEGHPVGTLPSATLKAIRKEVMVRADSAEAVQALFDEAMSSQASNGGAEKLLRDRGFIVGLPDGTSTRNTASPIVTNVNEHRPGLAALEKLRSITDDGLRFGPISGGNMRMIDPDNPETKSLRAYNRKKMEPILDECEKMHIEKVGNDAYWGALLDSSDPDEQIQREFKALAMTDSYTTAIAQVPNQPTIFRWIAEQAFQDQRMLKFVGAMGPGQGGESANTTGWELQRGIGRVFKVLYESYGNPASYGAGYGAYTNGLATPENVGIPEGSPEYYWDTFFPAWKKNATSETVEAMRSIGNGPMNLSLTARMLYHCGAYKSRVVDQLIANELPNICLEYGATAVANETYTGGNHGLANCTVFPAATPINVNLNPAKIASAAVVLNIDDYVTYPTPGVTPGNGQAPIAALRLLGGTAVNNNAAPYFGTNTFTKNPIVPPRATLGLSNAGADQPGTTNPISMTAPANMVLGLLGPDGYIYPSAANIQANVTPTYAVDWANGVIVFASGVVAAGGVINTTVTVSYSYATNFDPFPIVPGINGMQALAVGETPIQFMNRLLAQIDFTSATQALWPRFVAPDLLLMSAGVSPNITQAANFWKFQSPNETDLYPDQEFFATRNGVNMARLNTPWWPGNALMVLTRRYSTKYVIDTPWEMRGPNVKYDSAGNFIAGEGYYGVENSCICTPQVKDQNGNILNPVSRAILTVAGNTPL